MLPDSLLQGENAAWLDVLYQDWLRDPASVDPRWAATFAELGAAPVNGHLPGEGPRFRPRSIFDPGGLPGTAEIRDAAATRQTGVVRLINAWRVRGHMEARIDPLERRETGGHPELGLAFYGLTDADLDAVVPTAPLSGLPARASLRQILDHLRAAYAGSIGAEYMNIQDNEQKLWVARQLETLPGRGVLNPTQEARVYRKLADAEHFERMLHTRFPGTKRFSLEGAETLIPLLDLVVEHAGVGGIREIVLGMAHRGRLNTLVNLLEKPARLIVSEFQDSGGTTQGSGDVKYHLGYSADTTTVRGHAIHLSLTPNPSHLEAVDPVVEGRVRAKQERIGDREHARVLPVLIHGDAAFSGQGLVMETLNLSELAGYRTGGTIHVIVNNQIGFTTPPSESRSTPYATDIARMLAVPILHVNGEDPRAVAAVAQLAVEWRQRFHRDVVIDMYCYRKHGHNEGDEPSFTQPLMYDQIRTRPTPREVYGRHLIRIGALTKDDLDRIDRESQAAMAAAAEDAPAPAARKRSSPAVAKGEDPDLGRYFADATAPSNQARKAREAADLKGLWARFTGASIHDPADTRFDADKLRKILRVANTAPDDFTVHAKIARLFAQRLAVVDEDQPLDWALGEQAAFGSLLSEGFRVRLSGQDCARGTFSHRHAVVTCVKTGREDQPLRRVAPGFAAIDSSLSEAAVLGFEVGYALDTPDALVMWEAQFGDFVNGAQIVIDQYITASEQKWGRHLGIVLMLPHGYEGQGPEHSSGRIERFLLQCAQDNLIVANVTTPAQLFHLLRQQVVRAVRVPLVLFTPKSLLRHPEATSRLAELATGRFQPVLDDPEPAPPGEVRRIALCSGKLYYELAAARRERGERRVSLVRVERLHPWPAAEIEAIAARSPGAEVVWVQEEPRNMGAWPLVLQWTLDTRGPQGLPRYVGRPAAAAPATGSHRKHLREQAAVIDETFRF